MRLAYICMDSGVPVLGRKGCSVHVQEVVRALGRAEVEVDLFAPRIEGKLPAGWSHVRLHEVPVGALGGLGGPGAREKAGWAANRRLTASLEYEGPFDLIYERYSLWSYAGMELARDTEVPGLLEVNAPLIEEQAQYRALLDRGKAEEVAERAFAAARALIAVSEEVAAYLEKYPGARDKIKVIPNGVDPERMRPGLVPTWPSEPGIFTVGFVGSLKPWHGLSVLLEAFHRLHQVEPKSRLLIVGDGPELAKVSDEVDRRGLQAAVHLTGSVSPAEIPGWLTSMDVAVAPYLPSRNFYFSPLKVFEYMAAGLPVVASEIGQIARVIQHDVNGVLFSPGGAQDLADALTRLRNDPELRIRLGQEARKTVLQRHTWDQVVRCILETARRTSPADLSPEGMAIS